MTTSSQTCRSKGRRYTFSSFLVSKVVVVIVGFFSLVILMLIAENMEYESSFNRTQSPHVLLKSSSYSPEDQTNTNTSLLPTDQIYKTRSAFVIPEYKLIFFTFPKVACSEWKRMFMRMNNNPDWCKIKNFDVHGRLKNKIKILNDYEPEVATLMMTSPDWIRAAIFREPKERVLSAFLDKALNTDHYERNCCKNLPTDDLQQQCIGNQEKFESFLFFVTEYPEECFNIHWEPQVAKIDPKWWPFIDVIGYHHNLQRDSKDILSSLFSSRTRDHEDHGDGASSSSQSAWDKYGVAGWGNSAAGGGGCHENRTRSFLEENSSIHNFGAGEQMRKWYTAETERLVEKKWAIEWSNGKVRFPALELFPRQEVD